ncbi:MAG: pyruvate kinase [Bacteroidales bacterium]|jgi:pyruvate kinase|nr:pyruvate kinase [Bacteroidales bacterium]
MTSKFTKIVATISDRRCDIPFLQQLFDEGMNVVRLNSAHLDTAGFDKIIHNVRAVSNHIAILVDTKGPEVRTTANEEEGYIALHTGDTLQIKGNPEQLTTKSCICVSYRNFVADLKIGDHILFDDGEIEVQVKEKHADYLLCEVLNDGALGSKKSVNIPGVRINLPSLTEKDKVSIDYCIKNDVDFIAHSFVRNKHDILAIQNILDEQKSPIKIIAKIENQEGVDNIDEILEYAYGVMIARGDLGIEVPQEKIPGIQRVLIRKCVLAHKPVIVATQMLHSMIEHPRPTRAEITDIANAIYYRTDALMLSGETANGKYPVEAVRTMAQVAREAELTKMSENDIPIHYDDDKFDTMSFLAKTAVNANELLGTKMTITDSLTGKTARTLAAYRAKNPVIAICYEERTTRLLALSYGVFPQYQEQKDSSREYFFCAIKKLLRDEWLTQDDYISYLSGSQGVGGGTTFIEINQVRKMLQSIRKTTLVGMEK